MNWLNHYPLWMAGVWWFIYGIEMVGGWILGKVIGEWIIRNKEKIKHDFTVSSKGGGTRLTMECGDCGDAYILTTWDPIADLYHLKDAHGSLRYLIDCARKHKCKEHSLR